MSKRTDLSLGYQRSLLSIPVPKQAPTHASMPQCSASTRHQLLGPQAESHCSKAASLKRKASSTSDLCHLRNFNTKYLGLPATTAKTYNTGKDTPFSFSSVVSNLVVASKAIPPWKQSLPSKFDLRRQSFGREDSNHSFTQSACFETIMFHVLKSGFLDTQSKTCLSDSHKLIHHMDQVITKCATYDFSWLRCYDKTYATQQNIPKMRSWPACSITTWM